jgi:hypothetical protein
MYSPLEKEHKHSKGREKICKSYMYMSYLPIYEYMCSNANIHVYICRYIHLYIHIHTYFYIYLHFSIYISDYQFVKKAYKYTYMCVNIHTCAFVNTLYIYHVFNLHVYRCRYLHLYVYIYLHHYSTYIGDKQFAKKAYKYTYMFI